MESSKRGPYRKHEPQRWDNLIRENIVYLCQLRDMPNKALADKMQIPSTTWYKILNGQSPVTADMVGRVAGIFNIHPALLISSKVSRWGAHDMTQLSEMLKLMTEHRGIRAGMLSRLEELKAIYRHDLDSLKKVAARSRST